MGRRSKFKKPMSKVLEELRQRALQQQAEALAAVEAQQEQEKPKRKASKRVDVPSAEPIFMNDVVIEESEAV